MTQLTDEQYTRLVRPREQLWWWVKDTRKLSIEKVVEGVLARGTLGEFSILFDVLGRDRVKNIFLNQISANRHNYRPQTVNLLRVVFSDAP